MSNTDFAPLLAVNADLDKLVYPVYASPKLDGIRCVVRNGVPLSRKLKPIPNKYIQKVFADYTNCLDGLDGELIVGPITATDVFQKTTSGVMSYDGQPKFAYCVFDDTDFPDTPFIDRWINRDLGLLPSFLHRVPQLLIENRAQLDIIEARYVEMGYEGIMVRSPRGKYKHGRSTAKEGILLKVKRFEDIELEVAGFEERMVNTNEATKDALGHARRSQHQGGMVPAGTLGAVICRYNEGTVAVGTGFNDAQRAQIWEDKELYLGKRAKIKHQPSGAKDSLRFPVFLGWRHDND